MKTFLEPFENLTAVESLREALSRRGKVYDITGCADKAHLVFGIGHDINYKLLITADELTARELLYFSLQRTFYSISRTSEVTP